jgi:DNA (cytosine-5)-methyltransferase 1
MKAQYTVLDLFAGAGGLTEGFIRNNFSPVSHIEMNPMLL